MQNENHIVKDQLLTKLDEIYTHLQLLKFDYPDQLVFVLRKLAGDFLQ